MFKKIKSSLIVVGIIVGGAAIAGILIALSPEPPREDPNIQHPLVQVVPDVVVALTDGE